MRQAEAFLLHLTHTTAKNAKSGVIKTADELAPAWVTDGTAPPEPVDKPKEILPPKPEIAQSELKHQLDEKSRMSHKAGDMLWQVHILTPNP